MNDDELAQLDEVLDSLDRLYDRLASVADVQALLQATATALAAPDWKRLLTDAADALRVLQGARVDPEELYRRSLAVTDDVRQAIAGL